MFSNFSPETKKVINLARDEAQKFNQYYIGVEHLFLGLCQIADPALDKVLIEFRLNTVGVEKLYSILIPDEDEPVWGCEFIYTPRAKKILLFSEKLCKVMQNLYIYPTHIMLAIMIEGRSIPIRMLKELDLNFTHIQSSLIEVAKNQHPPEYEIESATNDTPYLKRYGKNLTLQARQGKLDPIIGREQEIQQLAWILKKKQKNNPLILGEAGVGKTHLVEGLAQEIISPHLETTKGLKDRHIIEIDLNSLVSGTMYRGEFEIRLENIIKEVMNNRIILFIDELHTLMTAGSATGAHSAAQIMKPYLSRGDIQCIGVTTLKDYSQFIESDKAFARRFEIIQLKEPSQKKTLEILRGLKSVYEKYHQVLIEEDALKAAVEYAARYFSDRHFPDKAIDLLDTACAQYEIDKTEYSSINRRNIANIVFQKLGIHPQLEQDSKELLIHFKKKLFERIFGQEEAITSIVNIIRNTKAGLTAPHRPDGVFLLCGPTGVGKTELVRVLADILFGDKNAMVRIDMSEYMERHTVSRLIGAPPGYEAYKEGGILTESVRQHPYAIVLLDEIEKAHNDVVNILLQVFDDGRLTDGHGRTTDFSNTLIFMTSNLGAEQIKNKNLIGFGNIQRPSAEKEYKMLKKVVLTEVKNHFSAEFLNRIDEVIVFKPLNKAILRNIIDKFLYQIHQRPGLKEKNITLQFDDTLYEMLIDQGYSDTLGAREMERTIRKLIMNPLGQLLVQDNITQNSTFKVQIETDRVSFNKL